MIIWTRVSADELKDMVRLWMYFKGAEFMDGLDVKGDTTKTRMTSRFGGEEVSST